MTRQLRWALAVAGVFSVGGCTPESGSSVGGAGVQPPATYVERLGSDTMAVHRLMRDGTSAAVTLVSRSPVTQRLAYRSEVDVSGRYRRIEGTLSVPGRGPEAPAPTWFEATVDGDSIRMAGSRGADTIRQTIEAPPEPVLLPPRPIPLDAFEAMARRLEARGGDSIAMTMVLIPAGRLLPTVVSRRTPDTLAVRNPTGGDILVALDGDGAVGGVDAGETTVAIRITPEVADLDALLADFVRRDTAGAALGVASPSAQVVASIGGADLEVRYARPARRGRRIWGGLVPWESVWRTGANAATHFTTSRDLKFGDVVIPAGTYTLWSTYTPDSAELIFNAQTNQWGTQYDPSQDIARVTLTRSEQTPALERLTIGLEAADAPGRGRVVIGWADRRYGVEFDVR